MSAPRRAGSWKSGREKTPSSILWPESYLRKDAVLHLVAGVVPGKIRVIYEC